MEILIGFLCAVLLAVFIVQIGKARELASAVRNDKNEEYEINKLQAGLGVVFMVLFLAVCLGSFVYYTQYILGWGPNTAASEHGTEVDYMFNLTLFFTGVVFLITQFCLFWFAWKYRGRKGHKAIYWAHNEKLEMVWMIAPAIVLTFLVVGGLQAWNNIMIDKGDHDIEIEATGYQFAWALRYPGRDNQLGTKHFTLIKQGENELGQDWTDEKNIDDFLPDKIVLPVGKKVRVRITSRDVLHNFYLPQFRVKMDAVPGMPTYFIFTPTVTTDSMRRRLSELPEWQVPDKNDASKKRWETYDYELACAELCGKGHFSMRRVVKIVTEEEYQAWLDEQEKNSFYLTNVRGKANDPFASKALAIEDLLKQKDLVNTQVIAAQDALAAAKKANNAAEVTKLTTALVEFAKLQLTARTTLDVQAATKAAADAATLAQQVLQPVVTTPAVDSVATDSTVQ